MVIFPVGTGETWRLFFAKCVLKLTGTEATNAFQDDHICDSLKVLIDGSIHGVKDIRDANSSTENWGFLLVNTKNVFNEINRIVMLCMVRDLWPYRAHFFNYYSNWSLIVLHNGYGAASFLRNREGAIHGGALAMVTYGIDILLLIKKLKSVYPDITQPCYACNTGALGRYKTASYILIN